MRYKSHPWRGIPSDTVKYEVAKTMGYLENDQPQKFSDIVPALYGFVPQ